MRQEPTFSRLTHRSSGDSRGKGDKLNPNHRGNQTICTKRPRELADSYAFWDSITTRFPEEPITHQGIASQVSSSSDIFCRGHPTGLVLGQEHSAQLAGGGPGACQDVYRA